MGRRGWDGDIDLHTLPYQAIHIQDFEFQNCKSCKSQCLTPYTNDGFAVAFQTPDPRSLPRSFSTQSSLYADPWG